MHLATDFGVLEEAYNYQGTNIQEDVRELNRTQA